MGYRLHLSAPKTAHPGELLLIRAKLTHPMEPGWRQRQDGSTIPRHLIKSLSCLYNGREIFNARLDAGVSADPYLAFHLRAGDSGEIRCVWLSESGQQYTKSTHLEVLPAEG